jgi:hypothetical protein
MFGPVAARLAGVALLAGALAGLAPLAHADDFHTLLGAGVGAVAGAAIGQSVGGRNGAIVGAGAGGLVGASIANQGGYSQQRSIPVQQAYAPNPYPVTYYQQPVVAWQAPQPQYRGNWQPVAYYRPPVTVWQAPQPEYRYWREERRHEHDHGHHERYDAPQWGHGDGRHDRRD